MKKHLLTFSLLTITLGTFIEVSAQGLSNTIRFTVTDVSSGISDETVVRFHPSATAGWDGNYDAHKLFSNNVQAPSLFTLSSEGYEMSINAYSELNQDYTLNLYMIAPQGGDYTLSYEVLGAFDASTYIAVKNEFTDTYTALQQLPVSFSMSASLDTFAAFQLSISVPPVLSVLSQPCPETSSGVLAVSDVGNANFSYAIHDELGAIVHSATDLAGSATIEGLADGGYELILSSATGEVNTLNINMEATSNVELFREVDNASCEAAEDGRISLEAVAGDGPFALTWEHTASSAWQLDELAPGTYTAELTDANGCTFAVEEVVDAMDPQLAMISTGNGQTSYEVGQLVTFTNSSLDAGTSNWELDGVQKEGMTVLHRFEQAGTYEVRLIGSEGACFSEDAMNVNITPTEAPLSAGAVMGQLSPKVYALGNTVMMEDVVSSRQSAVEIEVYDLLGKQITRLQRPASSRMTFSLPVSTPGVYIALIRADEPIQTFRFQVY